MGSPSTQNETVYQTARAEVSIQGFTFSTTEKFSSEVIESTHLIPKEMAVKALESLVTKLKSELEAGDIN